ncbi:DHA2 family efflux MFS transporter permease subunit [Conexibacter sp. SYSU D00693]|uniref:DHA2 family efflux MFS transporter permease subunit n=1 Tax=Conexibacter sp. SYSU D00693 TaxID=2812560 RepID=UPI00196A511F|nr:DHA2 family efflux MFS transporter permease subunit [Conexibacter sp. SYSU D00693]
MSGPASRMSREWKVLLVTSVGVFMALLDVTIVNVAFPDIEATFRDTPLTDLSWVLNAYNVVVAALLVPFGRLADRVGRRRMFYVGFWTFLAGSLASGAAPSAEVLIAARVLQAVGAAALIPSSLGLVLPEFAPDKRATATSVWAAVGAVAAATGPSLGGVLVDAAGWRWAFYVNVAFVVVLVACRRLLREHRDTESAQRIDGIGAGLIATGVGALALGIVKAPDWGWGDTRVVAAWATAGVLLALLVRWSRRVDEPILEPELLQIRSFALANGAYFVFSLAFFSLLLANVLFLTSVWGYTVLEAGFAVSPGPLAAAVAAGVGGRLADRLGPRPVALAGTLVFGVACLLYRDLTGMAPDYLGHWLPAQLVSGVGIGLVFSGLTTAVVMDLPADRVATGTAVASCSRQVGAVLGIAGLVAIVGTPQSLQQAAERFDQAWLLMAVCAFASIACVLPLARRVTAVEVERERPAVREEALVLAG